MKVKDYMTRGIVKIDADATVKDACKLMAEKRVSGLFVTGEKKGVFTDTDLINLLSQGKSLNTKLEEVMSTTIYSIPEDASIREAAQEIKKNGVSRLFVFNHQEEPVGIISMGDIIRALRDSFK